MDFNEAKGGFFVTMVQILCHFIFFAHFVGVIDGASIAWWLYPVENVLSICSLSYQEWNNHAVS
jgi:Na+-driven multidrug efflux pump